MNTKIKTTSQKSKPMNRLLKPGLVLSLIAIAGVLTLVVIIGTKTNSNKANPISSVSKKDTANTEAPDGKQDKPQASSQAGKDSEQVSRPEAGKQNASVIIIDAGAYDDGVEVRAFVQNAVQNGKCTITFTQGGSSIKKDVGTYVSASSTACENLTLPRSEFPSQGDWKVKVAFVSNDYSGVSSEQTIKL